jgi:hypothetical protein
MDTARSRLPATPALDELERCLAYFGEGYRLGFTTGRQIGYAQGENAEAELWADALGIAKRHAELPTWAELQRRRAQPVDVPAWLAEYAERDRRHQAEVFRRAGDTQLRRGAA